MKRDRNNQFIKRITIGVLLFVLSLSVMSVFNQKGNTALASEATEVDHTIKVDGKKAYISVEYSGVDANIYIEESGAAAVPETPENYSTWIFAGWYEEDTCDTPIKKSVGNLATCYAKFVPEKVLSVKCQTQEVEEGKSNLRFVTSIDTTNYYRAGFEVSREYSVTNEEGTTTEVKTYKKETNNSFKRIVASLDSKVKFEYSPKVIDTKSESFVTYTIKNIPSSNYGTEFLVKPYWITLDGAKVYGVSRYVTINDDENTVINIPVKVEAKADGTYSSENFTVQKVSKATDGTEGFTDVTGTTVRYRANEGYASIILSEQANLKSATKYQVNGSGTATYVHRNLETVYTGTNTEDTSWYTVYDEDTTKEYVIATAADLYGLAKLTTNTDGNKKTFAGKTIYVVSDIEANKGTASESSWSGDTSHEWTPIGNNNVKFSGVFDGQMHTISAICDQTVSASYSGLFGYTADESLVSKFRLTNSYFYHGTTTDWLGYGSIVGCCEGDIDTVYSNANLNYAGDIRQIAGIAGRVSGNGTTTGDVEITNCWFDGTIACGDATKQLGVGGVVGASNQVTTLDITNCLNTGSITQTGETTADISFCIGGILGTDWGANCIITINNCLNAGSIATESTTAVGTIIGKITQKTATYSIDKTYCISETTISNTIGAKNNAATITKNNITPKDADDVNGCVSYLNVSDLGFYGNSKTTEENEDKYWVAREEATNIKDGVPALKSFAEYIDVAWYYDTEDYDAGNNTYTIYTEEELFGFSEIAQGYNFKDDIVQLGDDIEVNMGGDAEKWAAGTETPERQWRPIGSNTADYRFAGTFNGEDPKTGEIHTISGIYITSTDTQYIGFFSTIAADGVVKNFRLTNSYMYAKNTSTTGDKLAWGSIAGGVYGDIDTVYTNMHLRYDNGRQIGGIAGRIAGTTLQEIKNCWSDGTMELIGNSKLQQAGGIAGATNANAIVTFDNCLNTRQIIVSGALASNGRIAGIFGGDNGQSTITMKNCLEAGTIADSSTYSGNKYIGSIIGRMNNAQSVYMINNVYCKESTFSVVGSRNVVATEEVIVPVDAKNLNDENGFLYTTLNFKDVWAVRKDDVPGLQAFVEGEDINLDKARYDVRWYYDFANADANTYTINNEDELYGLAYLVNAGIETFVDEEGVKKTVRLGDDIAINAVAEDTIAKWESGDETPINVWMPIGTKDRRFAGIFDGKDSITNELHTISGLYLNATDSSYVGLFGVTDTGSELKNFRLTDSYLKSRGVSYVGTGSIAGENRGSIDTVYSSAILDTNLRQAGGIVGRLNDMVKDGVNKVTVDNCWFVGTLNTSRGGEVHGGGIAGTASQGQVEITNTLHSGKITWSYKEDKNLYLGGILGSDFGEATIRIANCLSAGETEVSCDNYVGAVVGGINKATSVYIIENTYATTETYKTAEEVSVSVGYINESNEQSSVDIKTVDKNNLIGRKAYNQTEFDFEKDWTAVAYGVPAPKNFENVVKDIEWLSLDTSWYRESPDLLTFELNTVARLYGVSYLVNRGVDEFAGQTISLTGNIEVNESSEAIVSSWKVDGEGEVVPANEWIPIGTKTSGKRFAGTFNGNGNAISGIYVSTDDNTGTYVGLFGSVNTTGVVQNLKLMDSYFSYNGTANSNENKELHLMMGSITAELRGCLQNVYSNAIIDSTASNVGGLVSRAVDTSTNEGEQVNILSGWFDGEVNLTGNARYSGGIVATTGGGNHLIDNCLNTGVISCERASGLYVGGILGTDYLAADGIEITNCLSEGTLMLSSTSYAGTIVGTVNKVTNVATDESGATIGHIGKYTITNSYATEQTTTSDASISRIGGKSGYTNEFAALREGITTVEAKEIEGRNAYSMSLDFENIWVARAYDVPGIKYLTSQEEQLLLDTTWYRTDESVSPYTLSTADQLYGLGYLVNNGIDNFAGEEIVLGETGIVVNSTEEKGTVYSWKDSKNAPVNEWIPIGIDLEGSRFAGTFNANSKKISGVYLDTTKSETYKGLFGATESGSSIRNLRLTDSYFNCSGAKAYMGSIVGDLRGDITNVYSDAIIGSRGDQTGGLIGQVNAISETVEITNCWYDGQLTSSKNEVGGLVARVAQGTVNVDNCLNTGIITSTYNDANNIVGGICARVQGQTTVLSITDSIAAGKITDVGYGKNVKSVVGYMQGSTVNFDNVFATKSAYGRALPSEGTLKVGENTYKGAYTGSVIRTHKANRLIGYCLGEVKTGETAPKLDFTTDWTIRTSDVPVPTCFADLVTPVAVAEESTLEATLNTQIGLDTLGLSVVNAIDMGEGNYVLETTVDDTSYSNYVAKLEGDLGFGEPVAENSAGAGADGVHSVSYKKQNPDWVLTLTYVEATDVLTISINTDIDSLSDNLVYTEGVEDENYKATGDITFSMLQMKEYTVDGEGKEIPVDAIYADLSGYPFNNTSYWYGNSFVFQLPNGHFIVNDGGARQEFADLVTYLKTAAGTTEDGQNPVYIDAWIVSHQHGDHFDVIRAASDALRDESSNLMDNIYVDAFYINEPNAKVLANASLDDDVDSQYNAMTLFTKGPDGEQADIYRMQTGQRYYFNGLVMDVIQAQEQISYSKYAKYNASSSDPDFNTVSTMTLFTTSNNQKILIGGDANYANMQYIMDAYGIENDYTKAALLKNINVFVAFHHGKNMSMNINGIVDNSFIDYLTKDGSETGHLFDHVLYPCSLIYSDDSDPAWAFPNAEEANNYLNNRAKVFKHFGDGNVEITLQ